MGLTDKQREFAASQHYVVEEFLKSRHLPEDEYYDIVVFPYLEAVAVCSDFDAVEEFKAMANEKMGKAADMHRRSIRKNRELSLDYALNESGTLTLHDVISDGSDLCEDFCRREMMRQKPAVKRVYRMRGNNLLNGEPAAYKIVKERGAVYFKDSCAQYEAIAA